MTASIVEKSYIGLKHQLTNIKHYDCAPSLIYFIHILLRYDIKIIKLSVEVAIINSPINNNYSIYIAMKLYIIVYTSHKSTILRPTHTNLCFILASTLLRVRSFGVIRGHPSIFAVGRKLVRPLPPASVTLQRPRVRECSAVPVWQGFGNKIQVEVSKRCSNRPFVLDKGMGINHSNAT